MIYPRWHILSGRKYTPACATDITKTFEEARKRLEAEQKLRQVINMKREKRA